MYVSFCLYTYVSVCVCMFMYVYVCICLYMYVSKVGAAQTQCARHRGDDAGGMPSCSYDENGIIVHIFHVFILIHILVGIDMY